MVLECGDDNKIHAHARRGLPPALALTRSRYRTCTCRSLAHTRPPPPTAAPPRAARPHRTTVLDCALPVSVPALLSFSLRISTVHHPTRQGWKGADVLTLRGVTSSTPSGGKQPPPFPLSCFLCAAHTGILEPLPHTDTLVSLGVTLFWRAEEWTAAWSM